VTDAFRDNPPARYDIESALAEEAEKALTPEGRALVEHGLYKTRSYPVDDDDCAVLNEARAMLNRKGADYATEDRLAQFRRAAAEFGLSMRQVWAIYFDKGYAAIRKWVRGGELASEGIRERIVDAIAYLTILSWIVADEAGAHEREATPAEALHEMTTDALAQLRDVADRQGAADDMDTIHEATNTLALVVTALEQRR
jgi:hypothetical protein